MVFIETKIWGMCDHEKEAFDDINRREKRMEGKGGIWYAKREGGVGRYEPSPAPEKNKNKNKRE